MADESIIIPTAVDDGDAYDRGDVKMLYKISKTLSASLIDLRKMFFGDLDLLLIYLVFAMGDLSRRADGGEPRGINALSVADITLIPRETTRRKLRELAAGDFLHCGCDGLWYLGEAAKLDLLAGPFATMLGGGLQGAGKSLVA